jgi:PGF-pre-PGF domain-containing protein
MKYQYSVLFILLLLLCAGTRAFLEDDTYSQYGQDTNPLEETPIFGACPPEMILICHLVNGETNICIVQDALSGHLSHGDYEGDCVNEKADTKELANILANQAIVLEFNNDIKVSFKALRFKPRATIKARVRNVPPLQIPNEARAVNKYIVIEHSDIGNPEIADSKLEFTVSEGWLLSNKIKKEEVILSKYIEDNASWKDLNTIYANTLGNIHYYEADTEGFSTFAVTFKIIETPVVPVNVSEKTEETEEIQEAPAATLNDAKERYFNRFLTLPYILGAGLIVLFIIFTRFMSSKKTKKEEKENPEIKRYKGVLEFIDQLKKKNKSEEEIEKELAKAGWEIEERYILLKLYAEKKK